MSEQKQSSFMQELDHWTHRDIVGALYKASGYDIDVHSPEWEQAVDDVNRAIRAKVLESYRSGQAAGPSKPPARKEPRR